MRLKKHYIALLMTLIVIVTAIPPMVFARNGPGIDLTLNADKETYRLGETATFTITVFNNGDRGTHNNIRVLVVGTEQQWDINQIKRGESLTYTYYATPTEIGVFTATVRVVDRRGFDIIDPVKLTVAIESTDVYPPSTIPNDSPIDHDQLERLLYAEYIEVIQNEDTTVRAIDGNFTTKTVHNSEDAIIVFEQLAPVLLPYGEQHSSLNLKPDDIEISSVGEGNFEEKFFRLYPTINGIKVFGSELILAVNNDGVVHGFFTSFDNRISSVNTTPSITGEEAEQAVINDLINELNITLTSPSSSVAEDNISYIIRDYLEIGSSLFIDSLDRERGPILAWLVTVNNKFTYGYEENDETESSYAALSVGDNGELPFISMSYHVYADGSKAGEVYSKESSVMAWQNATDTASCARDIPRDINVQRQFLSWRMRDDIRNIETFITTFSEGGYTAFPPITTQSGIVRRSSGNWPERAVSAHVNLAAAYDFYLKLGRESFDGNGTTIRSSILWSNTRDEGYCRAGFNVTSNAASGNTWAWFMFGNGHPFEAALDVVGHEFTHGVIATIVGGSSWLTSLGRPNSNSESGALNEAYSDIMGMLIEGKPRSDPGRWLMGEDSCDGKDCCNSCDDEVCSGGIARDLSNPSSICGFAHPHPQLGPCIFPVAHYDDIVNFSSPHCSSLVFSHAVYRMMEDTRNSAISDTIWANIFYSSLYRLQVDATFLDARFAILNVARFASRTPSERSAIEDAFNAVGIGSQQSILPTPTPSVTPTPMATPTDIPTSGTPTITPLPGTPTTTPLPGTPTVTLPPGTPTVTLLPGTPTVTLPPGTPTVTLPPGTPTVTLPLGPPPTVTPVLPWTPTATPVLPTVTPQPGTLITITSDKEVYQPNERAVFTITVTNHGNTLNGKSLAISGTNHYATIEQSVFGETHIFLYSVTLTQRGSYTVTARVVDENGNAITAPASHTVNVIQVPTPTPWFTFFPTPTPTPQPPMLVPFTP